MRVSSIRVEVVKEKWVSYEAPAKINTSEEAAVLMRAKIGNSDRENFVAILLDNKNRPLGVQTVSIGSLTAAIVHPREVYKAAIISNAAAIVAGHNHPSGDTTPSREDLVITKRLKESGELLGIRFLDHLILGDDTFLSMADRGLLD